MNRVQQSEEIRDGVPGAFEGPGGAPPSSREQEPQRWFYRFAKDWVRPLVLALLILTPIRSSIADWNDVPSGSMMPTILIGDRIWVNKLSYGLRVPLTRKWVARWSEPERGSIVICHNPETDTRLVKRLVAVPGDTVQIRDGRLIVNGIEPRFSDPDDAVVSQLSEDAQYGRWFATETVAGVSRSIMHTPGMPRMRLSEEITVPEGQVFVMGDNRDQSQDSRAFGFVRMDDVVGRVGRVVASVDPDNYFMPRFDRFLQKLD